MAIPCQIEDFHTKLGTMCVAAPSDVRKLVGEYGSLLMRPIEPIQLAALVELWCDLTGQPPHTMLEEARLFRQMQWCLMRLCFMRHQGHNLQPPYEELWICDSIFCRLLGLSEADLTTWRSTWINTPEAQRLGVILSLVIHLRCLQSVMMVALSSYHRST